MHFVIINESAAIFAICASMGVQQTEANLINTENPWYGSQDRLVWFCNFFFVDRTQKIKLKWFQKWFLTPGTYSNCGKTIQDQDNMTDTPSHIDIILFEELTQRTTGCSWSKVYWTTSLSKTSVGSHVVRFVLHTYIHSYIHTYIHTYVDTYIHTNIHAYLHILNIQTYIHTYIYTCTLIYIHICIHA